MNEAVYDCLKGMIQELANANESNFLAHARHELANMLAPDADEMDRRMADHLLTMIALFSLEGHSGFSASIAIDGFRRLANFEPLHPLTGDDDEWSEDNGLKQNKRCSHVFMDPDGTAYDLDGYIFREASGHCFTNGDSRKPIEFPYTPERTYIDVDEHGIALNDEEWPLTKQAIVNQVGETLEQHGYKFEDCWDGGDESYVRVTSPNGRYRFDNNTEAVTAMVLTQNGSTILGNQEFRDTTLLDLFERVFIDD